MQVRVSRWGVASGGCKPEVKQLPLKGTGAARCRPPRSQAWLRGDKVSPNEADFDLRGMAPLPRNILHSRGVVPLTETGQRMGLKVLLDPTGRQGQRTPLCPMVPASHLLYLAGIRDSAERGLGQVGNRHLPHLVESISVNVGGSSQNEKVSSPPKFGMSVGGFIVLGARESRVRGEGS